VAKRKQKTKEFVEPDDGIDFGFFQNAVEEDATALIGGEQVKDPEPNKSGSYNLDYDLTVPFPAGRITEIFGEEGTCKTTLSLEIAGQAIAQGKTVLYVNMEKNLNLSLIRTVRTLRPVIDQAIAQMESGKTEHCPLWIVNAANGDAGFEAMRKFATMVPNGVAILDSIDAAQPEAVLSGEIGEQKVGNLPKLMSDSSRS
jgi:recombination protein RecA